MAYDLPWCQGLINALNIIIPKGTLIRASFPAACSMGTLGGGFMAMFPAVVAISKMLNSSEKYKELDVTALWGSVTGVLILAGVNQHGAHFVASFMDVEASGGGARPVADGLDNAGHWPVPGGSCPNVETNEGMYPVLYLYRRQRVDSGGMGEFRGGVGGEYCLVLHDAPTGEVPANLFGYGLEAGVNQGICGGYPGSNYRYLMVRDSDIYEMLEHGDLPKSIEELKGNLQEAELHKPFSLKNGDAFYFGWSGGGGYGDPIDRYPELVRKDVMDRLVSLKSAKEMYGVVIDPKTLEVDVEKTEQKREEIRKSRLTAQKAC
jgi:N-methylhydantoinase B